MQVSGGKVTYGRTVKTGDYENKRCDIELSFSTEDSGSAAGAVAHVADLAKSQCEATLGLVKGFQTGPIGGGGGTGAPTDKDRLEAQVRAQANGPRPVPTRAPAEPAKRGPGRPRVVPAISTGEERKDPVQEDPFDDGIPASLRRTVEAPVEVQDDPFSAEPAPVPEEVLPITDKDLTDAAGQKNAKIKNAVAIKQLVGRFVTFPKGLRDIPASKRRDFLTELEKL